MNGVLDGVEQGLHGPGVGNLKKLLESLEAGSAIQEPLWKAAREGGLLVEGHVSIQSGVPHGTRVASESAVATSASGAAVDRYGARMIAHALSESDTTSRTAVGGGQRSARSRSAVVCRPVLLFMVILVACLAFL